MCAQFDQFKIDENDEYLFTGINENILNESDYKDKVNKYHGIPKDLSNDDELGLLNKKKNLKEEISLFRNIDKLRLTKISLNLVFDLKSLEDCEEYFNFQIIRNDRFYSKKLCIKNIIYSREIYLQSKTKYFKVDKYFINMIARS